MGDIHQRSSAPVSKRFVSGLLLGQSDTAEALADREQSILPGNVVGSWKSTLPPQVIEVLSSDECLSLIACSKPNLNAMFLIRGQRHPCNRTHRWAAVKIRRSLYLFMVSPKLRATYAS